MAGNRAAARTSTTWPTTAATTPALHHLEAREIAGECAVVRTSAIRRYSPLLNEEIPYYFTSTEPYYSRENPKRERKIQSRSPGFCNSYLQPREPCGSRHHRPSKDTRTRPVRSRTSPFILNTKHTDKDRKLDEPPHGDHDHGVYKEPTRLSRTSSYLNSISPNLRPPNNIQKGWVVIASKCVFDLIFLDQFTRPVFICFDPI